MERQEPLIAAHEDGINETSTSFFSGPAPIHRIKRTSPLIETQELQQWRCQSVPEAVGTALTNGPTVTVDKL